MLAPRHARRHEDAEVSHLLVEQVDDTLTRGDQVLGTIVLASARERRFPRPIREMLRVISHQVGVSLKNARMYRAMEERATTDGLTGLTNHRAFRERLAQIHALAERTGQKFALILTDIDHFKKVNDTYGHDVGDVIIKGLGDILRRAKRNTDAVARFGGEEFVIICEETDARGAMLLAERVREELGKTTFHHGKAAAAPGGPGINVTCSVGVATFPEAGGTWEELFKAADEALYVSKRGGRNRSTAWAPPPAAAKGGRALPAA